MTAIASLVFCNDCGNLLEARGDEKKKLLKCEVCGATCKDTSAKVVVSQSKPSDFPSALRDKHSQVQTINPDDIQEDAITREPCPKCSNQEVRFSTQQLRSADEGQTIFYTCTKCSHKWTVNN